PLPGPVRRPRDRTDPLRRDAERRRRDRGRRDRRPDRRRRVLRHRHHREHRGARTVDHVVERRLGSRRPRPEPHGRLRGGEPRRPGVPRRDAVAHRRRRLGRGRPVPVGDDDGRGRRPGARAPDRVRRRAGVRDPRAVDVRGARVGRGRRGRGAAREPSVRTGGAADPPAGEATHPRRTGHGRRIRSVRGRARLDGQGRQGRLPREAGPRRPRPRGAGRTARGVHLRGDLGAARGLERGPRRGLGGPGHVGPDEPRGGGHRRPGGGARRVGERRHAVRDPVRSAPRGRDRRDAAVLRPGRRKAPVVNEPVRRSPLARSHADLGAVLDREAGWELVAHYGDEAAERANLVGRVALADVTARGKIDLRGSLEDALWAAGDVLSARIADDWAVLLCEPGGEEVLLPKVGAAAGAGSMVTDATHLFVGFALAGPELPEALARLTSWDPASLAAGEATGAPIGHVPAVVVRRDLPLPVLEAYVATEFARYALETILDAGRRAGGGGVGVGG